MIDPHDVTDTPSAAPAPAGFASQLMADAFFLREFISARGLYSKEILNANKALLTSIEKAQQEIDGAALTAETENAVLTAMGDVLQHLKCKRIDDLRRADSPRFKLALTAGRVVVFAMMLVCIGLALPLTLAFNQLTAMNEEIAKATETTIFQEYVDNWIKHNEITSKIHNINSHVSDTTGPMENMDTLADLKKAQVIADFKMKMQQEEWRTLIKPPATLVPLFVWLENWSNYTVDKHLNMLDEPFLSDDSQTMEQTELIDTSEIVDDAQIVDDSSMHKQNLAGESTIID